MTFNCDKGVYKFGVRGVCSVCKVKTPTYIQIKQRVVSCELYIRIYFVASGSCEVEVKVLNSTIMEKSIFRLFLFICLFLSISRLLSKIKSLRYLRQNTVQETNIYQLKACNYCLKPMSIESRWLSFFFMADLGSLQWKKCM